MKLPIKKNQVKKETVTAVEKAQQVIKDAEAIKLKKATDIITTAFKSINEIGYSVIPVGSFQGNNIVTDLAVVKI